MKHQTSPRIFRGMALMLFAVIVAATAVAQKPVRVACIGNSITYGMKLENRERDAYPFQLQRMLGEGYEVGNFGKNGATLLRRGHRPYLEQEEYRQAMDFAGDIVVIHLGVNDTDPRDWPNYGDEFVHDYMALMDSLRSVNPKARFIVARITPIADRHPRFQSGTKQWHEEIQKAIETVAAQSGAELIDFFAPLYPHPWMLPDAIHPNVEGAGLLAKTVYGAITGDYGGLSLPATFSDNMVLQRRQPLELHGTADAGSRVSARLFTAKDSVVAQAEAVANNRGEWSVHFPTLRTAEGLTLEFKAEKQTGKKASQKKVQAKTFRNVAVGEVWLCSGQSNMAFRVCESLGGAEDAAHAADDGLRIFNMKPRWETNNVTWSAEVIDSVRHLQYYKPTTWETATPENVLQLSAVAYHFGRVLRDSLRCPVGIICNAVGGSTTESWIDRDMLETRLPVVLKDWMHNDYIQDWCRGRAAKNLGLGEGIPSIHISGNTQDFNARHPYEPCYLFEAGILPLEHFPIRGVTWYQGESNAHFTEGHEKLFRLLVRSWRQYWNKPQLPFHTVQLSSLSRPSWPHFRDSQRRLAEEMNGVDMIVTTDVGDSLDVHPKNKRPVGERLARISLVNDYDFNLLPAGPMFQAAVVRDGEVICRFHNVEGLCTSDGCAPRTFELAGADGMFYPAEAIIERGRVVLSCVEVPEPTLVRYGWQPFTRANLVNADGLPASCFKAVVR